MKYISLFLFLIIFAQISSQEEAITTDSKVTQSGGTFSTTSISTGDSTGTYSQTGGILEFRNNNKHPLSFYFLI